MAVLIKDEGNLINSFYLHYKDMSTEDDIYELVKIDEHPAVELDLEWVGFNEITPSTKKEYEWKTLLNESKTITTSDENNGEQILILGLNQNLKTKLSFQCEIQVNNEKKIILPQNIDLEINTNFYSYDIRKDTELNWEDWSNLNCDYGFTIKIEKDYIHFKPYFIGYGTNKDGQIEGLDLEKGILTINNIQQYCEKKI